MTSYKLLKLQVTNFRNLESTVLEFSDRINCIFGENGNGKTNILEAIYVLIYRKSFRKNNSFPQFININGERPEIYFQSLFLSEFGDRLNYSGKMDTTGSSWYLNGVTTKKLLKEIHLVMVNPFDANLFHQEARERRSWFDHHLSLLSPSYQKDLHNYKNALQFRNSLLLKRPAKYRQQLLAIDRQMAQYSFALVHQKKDILAQIGPILMSTFQDVFSSNHCLTVELKSKFTHFSREDIFSFYQQNRDLDEKYSITKYGVHRDDYVLLFDGINSLDFCSLGQQKMSYLGLIFAYIELFRYKCNSYPIVLIDDVSGELDQLRWRRLIDYLKERNYQVLITTANDKFREELFTLKLAKKIKVDQGQIIQY